MNVSQLIAELEKAGVRLWEDAGQLRFRAPRGVLTESRRQALAENKPAVLEALRSQSTSPLTVDPSQRYEPFPLTDVQVAYLLGRHDAFGFGGVGCHLYVELEFGRVDPERLEAAWNRLVDRHDMLRAVIEGDGCQRVQAVVPRYEIPVTEARHADGRAAADAVAAARESMSHRIYATGTWPLFDLRVTRSPAKDIVHLSFDFLIADWTSIRLLLDELELLYQGRSGELPRLDVGFRDYVLAERRLRESWRYERDRTYWSDRIADLPVAPELPVLPKTTERPRFRRWTLRLPPDVWVAFCRRAAARNLTPSAAVLSVYAHVIGAWSRHPRFTLNLTLLNRLPLHPQIGRVVGDFTSVNLLGVDLTGGDRFAEEAARLSAQLFEDLDHRSFSGIEVMREMARRRGRPSALMPVVFTSAIGLDRTTTDRASAMEPKLGFGITQTPQVWIDCQAMDRGGALLVNWDVRESVFPVGLIDDMFGIFQASVYRLATADEAWDSTELVSLPAAQAERRRHADDTRTPLPETLLHEPVFAQALQTPKRLAVVSGSRRLTYGELAGRAAAVAARLRGLGCGAGDVVAVVADKGWEQVVAVLGALAVGAAYVPVDTHQPPARRADLIADAGVRVALTQSHIAASLPPGIVAVPVDEEGLLDGPVPMPERVVGAEALAYVIYTSGSTGKPKGVMMSHRSALNTVQDVIRRFAIGPEDRVLGLASLGFDLSVFDVFGPLAIGACLVLPDADGRSDPSHWADLVAAHRPTVWNSVPAQLQMLDDFVDTVDAISLSSLRVLLLSGDWIPVALASRIRARLPHACLVSLGGATEAAIWSIYHRIDEVRPEWRSVPYGMPLANQTVRVLDARFRVCPDWKTGDLYIGGVGLAEGYLGDAAKTAERFVVDPRTGERVYRTGDLGRYLPDGSIEFLGREDLQVKIRGHRIELAEVEAALRSHPGVGDAAVLVHGDDVMRRRLIGFVTTADPDGEPIDGVNLASYLAERLPQHMVPARVDVLVAFPTSDNGKLDRQALGALADGMPLGVDGSEYEEPCTDLERRLATLWAAVLEVPRVGRNQDFFQLGGTSLTAAKLVGRMREQIPEAGALFFDTLVRQLLPTPTVAALAAYLVSTRGEDVDRPPRRSPASPLVSLGGSNSGTTHVLIHDGAGRLTPYDALIETLAANGLVVGLAVNEAASYLRLAPTVLFERRATSYARLLDAHGARRVRVVGCGLAVPLALETARQLAENGIAVDGLTLLDEYRVPRDVDEELIDRMFELELGTRAGSAIPEDANVLREVFVHTLRAAALYRPAPYLGDVTLLGPADARGRAEPSDHASFWQALCVGDLRIVELGEGRSDWQRHVPDELARVLVPSADPRAA